MKGFTLIELLAVIVILGIILLVAVPIIGDLIDSTKINSVISSNKMLMKGLDTYIMKNDNVLPNNIGDTVEIALQDLIDGKYISNIKSPYTKNNCTGYILVTKIEDGYIKTPHINCINTISSTIEDNLIAHYSFDDYQDPTENLLLSPLDLTTDWNHRNMTAEKDADGFFKVTEDPILTHHIMGQLFQTEANTTYTMSCLVKKLGRNNIALTFSGYPHWTGLGGGHTYFDLDTGSIVSSLGTGPLDAGIKDVGNDTYKVWLTAKVTDVIPSRINIIMYEDATYTDYMGDETKGIYVKDCQLEKKDYVTPFTDSQRIGIIKDYSINDNIVNLEQEISPKWIEESSGRKGVYEFDGSNNRIKVPALDSMGDNQSNTTIAAWVKTSVSGEAILVRSDYSAGNGYFGLYTNGAYVRDVVHNHIWAASIDHLNNEWVHLTGVFDSTNQEVKFYVNGVEKQTNSWDGTVNVTTGKTYLGAIYRTTGDSNFFDGEIDDVKVYNRVLSPNEIKIMYELSK